MPIRLAFADDHPLILEALVSLFRAQEGFEIVATCRTGTEALRAVRERRPGILILDLRMPEKDGLDVLREIAAEGLPTKTILLAAVLEDAEIHEAISLGVRGVMLKGMDSRSVVQCVRKVYAGGIWLENRSAARTLEKLARWEGEGQKVASLLTPRELALVRQVGRGLRNKEIASRLSISEHTVKVHLSNVYAKLGVDGRLALLRYVEDKGIL